MRMTLHLMINLTESTFLQYCLLIVSFPICFHFSYILKKWFEVFFTQVLESLLKFIPMVFLYLPLILVRPSIFFFFVVGNEFAIADTLIEEITFILYDFKGQNNWILTYPSHLIQK